MPATFAVISAWDIPGRSQNETPLALRKLAGISLIEHSLQALTKCGIDNVLVASSMSANQTAQLKKNYPAVKWLSAKGRDAAGGFKSAAQFLAGHNTILVFDGLCPGADAAFLKKIIKQSPAEEVLSVSCGHQCGDDHASLLRINTDAYKSAFVKKSLLGIEDLLEDRQAEGLKTPHLSADLMQDFAVRDLASLAEAAKMTNSLINHRHMDKGVEILDPENTWIDAQVQIGRGTKILPYSFISGSSRLGKNCLVGPFARIENSRLEDQVHFEQSTAAGCVIRKEAKVGPWSRLRAGTDVGQGAKLGNFCEFKNAVIAPGVKAGHLSYLGDVTIGSDANIGAGTITANYDGKNKHQTRIGKNAFTGSNSVLVAPVSMGNNSKTGAGSVVLAGKNLGAGKTAVGNPARVLPTKRK